MSVPTLLENRVIYHWVSGRGDNFQCLLSSFSVKSLAWKCFPSPCDGNSHKWILLEAFYFHHSDCFIYVANHWFGVWEIAMFGQQRLMDWWVSSLFIKNVYIFKKSLKFQLLIPYVHDSDEQWSLLLFTSTLTVKSKLKDVIYLMVTHEHLGTCLEKQIG